MIVDAKGLIAGRLSTKIAKLLIQGEQVTILNAEDAIIVGNKDSIMEKFKTRVDANVKSNPHYGPKYSRIPDRILRRMIKGMLPRNGRTKEKLVKRLTVYNSTPKELAKEKAEIFEEFKCNERHKYITIKEIALLLGGRW
jgi:large subunit ribosomal protein L13